MPELPEVETIKRDLADRIVGLEIRRVEIGLETIIGYPKAAQFEEWAVGRTITGVGRRGKYILLPLEGEYEMAVHLRMSGRLLISVPGEARVKHLHVILGLGDAKELRFVNPRQFGRFYLFPAGEHHRAGLLDELGPEPLDHAFSFEDFRALFNGRRAAIKSLLLNQRFIAGLGNIYTDEILHRSGLRPDRPVDTMGVGELRRLYDAIRDVLMEGIECRGTSRRDYVDAGGRSGEFQDHLRVYSHEDEECPDCGQRIQKIRVAGRGSHFCPGCQE